MLIKYVSSNPILLQNLSVNLERVSSLPDDSSLNTTQGTYPFNLTGKRVKFGTKNDVIVITISSGGTVLGDIILVDNTVDILSDETLLFSFQKIADTSLSIILG